MKKRALFFKLLLLCVFSRMALAEGNSHERQVCTAPLKAEHSSPQADTLSSVQTEGFFPFLQAESFFRNNEYASPFGIGYTLPGYRITGSIGYRTSRWMKTLELHLGLYTLGYFGATRYPIDTWYRGLPWYQGKDKSASSAIYILPLFGLKLAFDEHLSLHFGHYGTGSSHRLPMPLYNEELMLSANPEQGIRFIAKYPWLWGDIWIDWQRFIFRRAPHQEAFTAGMSLQAPIYRKHQFQISGKAAWVASHRGGEINVMQEGDAVHTYFSGMAGLEAQWQFPAGIDEKTLNLAFSAYAALSRKPKGKPSPTTGKGIYLQSTAQYWRLFGGIRYWRGRDFTSPMGGPFINNGLIWEADESKSPRTISFFHFNLGYDFFQTALITLRFGVDAWYHLLPSPEKGRLSHALTLYVSFTPDLSFRRQ